MIKRILDSGSLLLEDVALEIIFTKEISDEQPK